MLQNIAEVLLGVVERHGTLWSVADHYGNVMAALRSSYVKELLRKTSILSITN